MNPGWLLVICPASTLLGVIAAALCAAAAQADAVRKLEQIRRRIEEHLERMKR